MSLDKLAIIFFIIILPIVVLLNAYTNGQIDTLNLQMSYDAKLKSATYDAVKAFQENTLSSSTSDLANSKMRDIEASVNAFFSSVATNFNIAGYNKNTLQEYVPALVYTMYDGYYIFSKYTNTIPEDTYKEKLSDGTYAKNSDGTDADGNDNATYKKGEKLYGIKPYVHYSCEYQRDDDDFVITYSLDNYITIQGIINGTWVNDSGYLISNVGNYGHRVGYIGTYIDYRNVTIKKEEPLMQEYINENKNENNLLKYHKINGVKYYYDGSKWFTILNGKEIDAGRSFNEDYDAQAYDYYYEAYQFRNRIIDQYQLENLTTDNIVEGNPLKTQGNGVEIFDRLSNSNNTYPGIEEPDSNFNQHRLAVIRYTIEKNLSIAIANYNQFSNSTANFRMPKLKEDDWDKILNNVSVISFMQGVNIGGKEYNGYSIVTNNNNEEVVAENSIYFADSNEQKYHNILEKGLNDKIKSGKYTGIGIFNTDLLMKSKTDGVNTTYYFPKLYYADYNSAIYQTNVINLEKEYNGNIYKYMDENPNLAKIYYTALGRERHSMYKVNNDAQKLLEEYAKNTP